MPTLTTRPKRAATDRRRTQKVVIAIVASLLLHGLLLLVLGWALPHWPKSHLHGGPINGPLRVTILPPEATPTPGPGNAPSREYMRTTDEQRSEKKPDDPAFESDKDTLAASEKPAEGHLPMPSQDGKQREAFDFDTTNYRPGKEASDAASNAPSAPPQPATTEQKPDEPPAPTATPKPKSAQPPKPAVAPATPAPDAELNAPKAEPSATPEVPAPTPEKPEDQTSNTPPQPTRQQSRTQPANQSNPSLVPNPGLPKPPGYQPQTVQTRFSGSINNRGKSAVAAIGTPMGRYIKNVQDSIGALWYYRVDAKMDMLSVGAVKINFHVNRSGRAVRVQVVSGDRNSALASVSTGAIMDADIPPIPSDLAAALPGGEFEMDLSFGFDTY